MKRVLVVFIVLFLGGLISCSGAPEHNLASEASLVHKGFSTKNEIRQLLGPPAQVVHRPDGREDWYYYQVRKDILKKLPWLGNHLGKEEVEVLHITFREGRVVDCIYYVAGEKSGT